MKPAEDLTTATAAGRTSDGRDWTRLFYALAGTAAVLIAAFGASQLMADGKGNDRVEAVAPPVGDHEPGHAIILDSVPPGSSAGGPLQANAPPPPAPRRPATLGNDSRLRLDGIAAVSWGMTVDAASAAAGVAIRVDPATDLGRGCAYAKPEGGPAGLAFMVVDGRIVRADVGRFAPDLSASPVATLSGIRIGSTEEQVQETYPDGIEIQLHPYTGHRGGHYLVYTSPAATADGFGLIFETDGQTVTGFRAGLTDPVIWPEGCA